MRILFALVAAVLLSTQVALGDLEFLLVVAGGYFALRVFLPYPDEVAPRWPWRRRSGEP